MVSRNRKTQPAITGIEPAKVSVPTMDRPSIAFAWFLDNMVMEWDGPTDGVTMHCALCGEGVCSVEAADTLRVLLNTALAHECGSHP